MKQIVWEILLFPRKTFKLRMIIFLILLVLIAVGFALGRREKTVAGTVLECGTNAPIPGADVSTHQIGWGFSNGSLAWDKDHVTSTKSDDAGHFTITYRVGDSAQLIVKKTGYLPAYQYEYPGKAIVIRILLGNYPAEVSYNCKRSSECLSCNVEDGVKVCKNICE